MADITFTKKFSHSDWTDGQSIVQAGGNDGFNTRFHGIENDLDAISRTFGAVNDAVKNLQQLKFVKAEGGVTINASTIKEVDVETYDKTNWPDANLDKIYSCLVVPTNPSDKVPLVHTFLYHPVGPQMRVTLALYNPQSVTTPTFSYRVLALGGLPS